MSEKVLPFGNALCPVCGKRMYEVVVSFEWIKKYITIERKRIDNKVEYHKYATKKMVLRDLLLAAEKEVEPKRTVLGEAKKIIEKNLPALKKMAVK